MPAVPLDGLTMHPRPAELRDVAAGLARFGVPGPEDPLSLVEAVRRLPANDRAPAWELAIRHFGRAKPLIQAAGEIGIDVVRAQDLVARFSLGLGGRPA